MRLLDRYLLRELIVPLGYCLGGFLVFWVSFDLFSQLSRFQKLGLKAGDIAGYYFIRAPEFLVLIMPVALLLALLYGLTTHSRHNEITAMRAAGISFWRLSIPYYLVGALCGAAVCAINEYWVPRNAERAQEIENRSGSTGPRDEVRNLILVNQRDGRIWRIGVYNRRLREMQRLDMTWQHVDGSREQYFAPRAVWTNKAWTFFEVKEHAYPAEAGRDPVERVKPEMTLPDLAETPARIRSEIKVSQLDSAKPGKQQTLSIREILDYFRLHPPELPPVGGEKERVAVERKRAILETRLHTLLAAPWTCLVVVMIAIPFGAAGGRRNAFAGVASSVGICFLYFFLQQFGVNLATGGSINAWIGAWAPNILFGLTGVVLNLRLR